MNRRDIFKSILVGGIAFMAMLAPGCMAEEIKPYAGCELGAEKDDYEVDIYANEEYIKVLSNMTYNISLLNDAKWVKFPSKSKNDEGFRVQYEENRGARRMAKFLLSVPEYNHSDTIYLRQLGVEDYFLTRSGSSVMVNGSESSLQTIDFSTNVPKEILTYTVNYSDTSEVGWLSNLRFEEIAEKEDCLNLCFDVAANPHEGILRRASVDVEYVDGWDMVVTKRIFITQLTSTDRYGVERTLKQLRDEMATTEGVLLEQDVIIDGVVVSNKESMNMGENTQTMTISIDYDECLRTVYIQSPDGKYGLMLKTENIEDNIFNRYDKVKLCLRGAKLYKSQVYLADDPTFCWVEGVTASMVIESEGGTAAELPQKKMRISQLTDDDIFTYVELQDCCLPIRKGAMTPINEGYANATGADRTSKFAIPLLDKEGNSIYIYTNTTCPYRRTGERLPYGEGSMKGIIVHEKFTRFAYEDNNSGDEETYGNIGRYQIRHTEYSDFAMKKEFKDGFSRMLCEWTHVTAKNLKSYPATAGDMKGEAILTHTFEYPTTSSLHGVTCINLHGDMSYLGPIGSNTKYPFGYNVTNMNGLGVILDDGTDWMAPTYSGVNSEYAANINASEPGKGKVPATCGSAWKVWYNIDVNKGNKPACSFIYEFPTIGVESDCVTVQFAMLNTESNGDYGPRYWNLEFATDGKGNDADWKHVARFSVPDEIKWSPVTQLWMCPGYKPMSFKLPAKEVCNKDMVYVRIRPEVQLHGNELNYATTEINSKNSGTMPWTAFNYFAVRCNK